MTFLVKKGTFAKNTTATPPNVDQAVTGVGFVPKAILFWVTEQTASGLADGANLSYGFSETNLGDSMVGGGATDNVGTTDTTRVASQTNNIILRNAATNASLCIGFIKSMDADGFTITWSTNNTVAYIIHYLAIGGTDVTDTKIASFSTPATGNQAVTGVGFQPDIVFFVSELDSSSDSNSDFGLGVAVSSTQRGAMATRTETGLVTSESDSRQATNRACMILNSASGAIIADFDFVSMDADGFTVNVTDAGFSWSYLAIKGGQYAVGSITSPASTGNQATTGVGFEPKALMLFGRSEVAGNTTSSPDMNVGIGATDGTTEGFAGIIDDNGVGTTETAQRNVTTKLVSSMNDANATGASTTIDEDGSLTSFDSDGFTINWASVDATAREWIYIAFGAVGGAITKIVTDTLSLSHTEKTTKTVKILDTITQSEIFKNAKSIILPDNISLTESVKTSKLIQILENILLNPPVFARPDSDITISTWSVPPLWSKIDETTPDDDTTNILSPANPTISNAIEVGLTNVTDPLKGNGHIIRFRTLLVDGGFGAGTLKAKIELIQGTTIISSSVEFDPSLSWTTHEHTLTNVEADSITDYTDLRLRITPRHVSGGIFSVRVTWAELEVPTPQVKITKIIKVLQNIALSEMVSKTISGAITKIVTDTLALTHNVKVSKTVKLLESITQSEIVKNSKVVKILQGIASSENVILAKDILFSENITFSNDVKVSKTVRIQETISQSTNILISKLVKITDSIGLTHLIDVIKPVGTGQTIPFGNISAQENSDFGNVSAQENSNLGNASAGDTCNLGDAKG